MMDGLISSDEISEEIAETNLSGGEEPEPEIETPDVSEHVSYLTSWDDPHFEYVEEDELLDNDQDVEVSGKPHAPSQLALHARKLDLKHRNLLRLVKPEIRERLGIANS